MQQALLDRGEAHHFCSTVVFVAPVMKLPAMKKIQ